jgi:hypothetical protein
MTTKTPKKLARRTMHRKSKYDFTGLKQRGDKVFFPGTDNMKNLGLNWGLSLIKGRYAMRRAAIDGEVGLWIHLLDHLPGKDEGPGDDQSQGN